MNAKEREDNHPITKAIKKDGCQFILVTATNTQSLRYAEHTGEFPVGKEAYDRISNIYESTIDKANTGATNVFNSEFQGGHQGSSGNSARPPLLLLAYAQDHNQTTIHSILEFQSFSEN